MITPYPLHWPSGWVRHTQRRDASFNCKVDTGKAVAEKQKVTLQVARERLDRELDAVGASAITLSMNVEMNLRGHPRGGERVPADPGVALYFRMGRGAAAREMALACDKWNRVPDNIVALAKHIEALRGMDRWGVGTAEQAFAGYQALPAPDSWWQVLDVASTATLAQIEAAYRDKARAAHPDHGGSNAAMARLNTARDAGKEARA